jgi:hypothetical protein
MKCPTCGLVSRPNAPYCDCGYEFVLTEEELSRLKEAVHVSNYGRPEVGTFHATRTDKSEPPEDPVLGPVMVLFGALMLGFGGGAIAWATLAGTGGIVLGAGIGAAVGAVVALISWQVAQPQARALRWASRHTEAGGNVYEAILGALQRSRGYVAVSAILGALLCAVLGGLFGYLISLSPGILLPRILLVLVGVVLGAGFGVVLGAKGARRDTVREVVLRWAIRKASRGRPRAAAMVGALWLALLGAAGGLGWSALWPGHEVLVILIAAAVLAPIGALAGRQLANSTPVESDQRGRPRLDGPMRTQPCDHVRRRQELVSGQSTPTPRPEK